MMTKETYLRVGQFLILLVKAGLALGLKSGAMIGNRSLAVSRIIVLSLVGLRMLRRTVAVEVRYEAKSEAHAICRTDKFSCPRV